MRVVNKDLENIINGAIEIIELVKRGVYKINRIDDAFELVSNYSGIHKNDFKSKSRMEPRCSWRQVGCFLAYNFSPDVSNEKIGRYLGGMDHTTITHARQEVEKRLSETGYNIENTT